MLVYLQQRVFLRVVTATSSQLPPSHSGHLCKVSVLPRITDLGRGTSRKPPPLPPAPLPRVHLAVRHLKGAWAAHFSGSSWACSVSRDLFLRLFIFICSLVPTYFVQTSQPHLSNADLQMEKEPYWLPLPKYFWTKRKSKVNTGCHSIKIHDEIKNTILKILVISLGNLHYLE